MGPVSKFDRSFHASWGDKKTLARVENNDTAVATDGTRVVLKNIQAVPVSQSNEVAVVHVDEEREARRREALEKLAGHIQDLMPAEGRIALSILGRKLNEALGDWRKEYLKPLRMSANESQGGALRSVLEVFSDMFELSGLGSQMNMFASLR